MLTDLRAAFTLLTRLPIRTGSPPDLAHCVWAFPIVGLLVNGIGGLVYCAIHKAGMPPLLAAAWTLAITLILTGALHEDGLADTADGFGGGATPARKLEIMRDSRIGSYGALALLLSTLIRTTAIAAVAQPTPVLAALIGAGVVGRGAMILPLLLLSPARPDGMGAAVRRPALTVAMPGLALSAIAPFLLLPAKPAGVAILLGFAAAWGLARLAHRQIGGHTGDVLGAIEVITECVVLAVLATWLAPSH
jgi:adenosylcobinamide-GDP ribazoletransferase